MVYMSFFDNLIDLLDGYLKTGLKNIRTNFSNGELTISPLANMIGLIFYLILIIINLSIIVYIYNSLRKVKIDKTFKFSLLGIFFGFFLIILNLAISKLFLYISDDKYTYLLFYKGFFAVWGYVFLFFSIPEIILVISNPLPTRKKKIRKIYRYVDLLFIIALIFDTASIFGILQFPSTVVLGVGSLIPVLVLIAIIILYNERKSAPSDIYKLKLSFLIIALIATIFAVIIDTTEIILFYKLIWANSNQLSNFYSTIAPFLRFVAYSLTILALFFGFFMPNSIKKVFGIQVSNSKN